MSESCPGPGKCTDQGCPAHYAELPINYIAYSAKYSAYLPTRAAMDAYAELVAEQGEAVADMWWRTRVLSAVRHANRKLGEHDA